MNRESSPLDGGEERYDSLKPYFSAQDMPWEGDAAAESRTYLGNGTVVERRTLLVGWGNFGRLVDDFRIVDANTGEVVDDKKEE